MVKKDFINELAKRTGLKKVDSERTVNAITEIIIDTLSKGEEVNITGFGKFIVRRKEEKNGRNPYNGESLIIPAHNVPVFKAGKILKEAVK